METAPNSVSHYYTKAPEQSCICTPVKKQSCKSARKARIYGHFDKKNLHCNPDTHCIKIAVQARLLQGISRWFPPFSRLGQATERLFARPDLPAVGQSPRPGAALRGAIPWGSDHRSAGPRDSSDPQSRSLQGRS